MSPKFRKNLVDFLFYLCYSVYETWKKLGGGVVMGEEEVVRELTEKEVLTKFLPDEEASTMSEAIDVAVFLSGELKDLEKRLDKYKALFKKVGEPGVQMNGETGFVLLVAAKKTEAEPGSLHQLLKDINREPEFYSLIKVQIAEARKVLGTTLFSKISTESPGVPRCKFGRLS